MISQIIILVAVAVVAFANPPVDHGYHHAAIPYKFGYSIKDKHGEQHREESGTGGHHVTGSYGFTDDRGIHRQVNYVADHGGFRAQVKTNEPGTANQNPAAVHIYSSAPVHDHLYGGYAGHGNVYASPGHGYAGHQHGYAGYGLAHAAHGYAGNPGLGYGYGSYGHGYNGFGYGAGYGGYGLASALLGTLPYARYGY